MVLIPQSSLFTYVNIAAWEVKHMRALVECIGIPRSEVAKLNDKVDVLFAMIEQASRVKSRKRIRELRQLRCQRCQRCGTVFDGLVEAGRKGGRQRKPFTDEERQRRRERLSLPSNIHSTDPKGVGLGGVHNPKKPSLTNSILGLIFAQC